MPAIQDAFELIQQYELQKSSQFKDKPIPDWVLIETQNVLLVDYALDLTPRQIMELLTQDQFLLGHIEELGLDDQSPVRFALGHSASRFHDRRYSISMSAK